MLCKRQGLKKNIFIANLYSMSIRPYNIVHEYLFLIRTQTATAIIIWLVHKRCGVTVVIHHMFHLKNNG